MWTRWGTLGSVEGQLCTMVVVVLLGPDQDVAPAHPWAEVGVPIGWHGHARGKLGVRGAGSPAQQPFGVSPHPPPGEPEAGHPGPGDAAGVVHPVVRARSCREGVGVPAGRRRRELGEPAHHREEHAGDVLTERHVPQQLAVRPSGALGWLVEPICGRGRQQGLEVASHPLEVETHLVGEHRTTLRRR